MSGRLIEKDLPEKLSDRLKTKHQSGVEIYWLGQAGFVFDIAGVRLVIDPYLSDSLAQKYHGTSRPHLRMSPPPVLPHEIPYVDFVLCTHAHTDHMDPGTLPRLLATSPAAKLVAPRALKAQVIERSGIGDERLILVNAGEHLSLLPKLSLVPTRAAHETLKTDAEGNHHFLGYVLRTDSLSLWHSGDCVPFNGLEEEVRPLAPDIALLPVNGRRPELSENGVPGNFTLGEAIDTSRRIGTSDMIAHHFGLFDFNTEDPTKVDATSAVNSDIRIHRARADFSLFWL
jgi:L-ascorbate metabolism protein UlaG (beta-lactamase superfamily)